MTQRKLKLKSLLLRRLQPRRLLPKKAAAAKMASSPQRSATPAEWLTNRNVGNSEYGIMFYKAGNAFAVRKRQGSQLFTVLAGDRSQQHVLRIMKEVVEKLTAGEDPAAVKAWARAQD